MNGFEWSTIHNALHEQHTTHMISGSREKRGELVWNARRDVAQPDNQ